MESVKFWSVCLVRVSLYARIIFSWILINIVSLMTTLIKFCCKITKKTNILTFNFMKLEVKWITDKIKY